MPDPCVVVSPPPATHALTTNLPDTQSSATRPRPHRRKRRRQFPSQAMRATPPTTEQDNARRHWIRMVRDRRSGTKWRHCRHRHHRRRRMAPDRHGGTRWQGTTCNHQEGARRYVVAVNATASTRRGTVAVAIAIAIAANAGRRATAVIGRQDVVIDAGQCPTATAGRGACGRR